jgi:16S rRNA (adenine1518-N6/adenine1519-N6)-dimethyltransferase
MNKIQAKKYLWQNFLKNKKILDMIVWDDSLEGISVIEVWPGPGDLTEAIIQKHPQSLTLIELDADMMPLIQERFHGSSFTVYQNDVLNINVVEEATTETKKGIHVILNSRIIPSSPYRVYGNIPYYITSPILHHFLYDVDLTPVVAVFTMQKEVADRILARENHSVLSLACQLVADVEKICDISPNNFIPVPKVWSTCLKFTTKKIPQEETKKILQLIKTWFSQKRKKLMTNLTQGWYNKEIITLAFQSMGLSENVRAEELWLEEWKSLYGFVAKKT